MQYQLNESNPNNLHGVRGTVKRLPKLVRDNGNPMHSEAQSDSQYSNAPNKPKLIKPKRGYQLAEYTKAVQYLHSQSYVRKIIGPDGNPDYQPYQVCVDTQQLKHYGLGVYLYLQFIKRLAVTLLVMSAILIVPIVYSYINGKGMNKYTQSYMIILAKSSLGNFSNADTTTYMIYTVCDILSMIVLFFFYLHWRSFHAQAVDNEAKDIKIVNPSNYVLSVIGFDPSTPNLQKNLITYFDQVFSGAYEVQVICDYNGNFSKFIHYDELVQQRQKQKQVMIQTGKSNEDFLAIQRQIKQFEDELSNIAQIFEAKQAIIHFRTLKAKYNYMNFCRKYSLIDKFSYNFKRFICCQHLPPQTQLFMGKTPLMIKSNSLSRPQQINWNNLDISKGSRVIRWIFAILLLIIFIAITTALIAICTLYVSSTSSCTDFDPNVITTVALAKAKGSQAVYCFCANHFTEIYTNPTYNEACGSLSNTILYTNLMQVGASLVSSISNVILILIIGVIAKYILKPDSKPKQYTFIFVSVLISNYINASVLPLVMNGDIFGFQSLTYLKFLDFIDFKNVAIFKDYNRDWYAIVAPYYITFLIIAMVSPVINYFTTCLMSCWSTWRLKSACDNNDVKDPLIQKQANKRIASTIFDLSVEQAIVVLNLLIAIMYSSLLPILIPITTLYLMSTFLFKKAIILRYSIKVPADHDLSQKTITLIPFMILVHFLMGIWAHTAEGFFAQSAYFIKNSFSFIGGSFDRVFKDLILLGALAVIAAWIIFDYTVISFFGLLQECCSKDEMQTPKQFATLQNKPYQQYVKSANVLDSYKLTKNPQYGHAFKAYIELKKNKEKQEKKRATLRQNMKLAQNSPQKFAGHQTSDSLNIRTNQQINLNPQHN